MAVGSRHLQNDIFAGRNAGPSGGVVAGLSVSGGLGVALPSASAKRSRLLSELLDDRSCVGRRLSPRDMAIIRLAVLVFLSNAKRWSAPCCPLTWHHQHFVVSTL